MKRREKRKLEQTVKSMHRMLEKDKKYFALYMPTVNSYEFFTDDVAVSALGAKILFIYAICLLKKRMGYNGKSFQWISEYMPALDTGNIDTESMECELMEYLTDSDSMSEDIFQMLTANFGWQYIVYENYVIDQGGASGTEFCEETDVVKFIDSYLERVRQDNADGGYMSLVVFSHKKYGLYKKYVQSCPDGIPKFLREEIESCMHLVSFPMAYYESDFANSMVSEQGNYISLFGYGFYSGYERHAEKYLVTSLALVCAYYAECYLDLALRYVTGFRKFYYKELAKQSVPAKEKGA